VAKTYVLQAVEPAPGAGLFIGQPNLADVSIWRKNYESTTNQFYWKNGIFSRRQEGGVDK
jgi:hypothetical protein